MTRVLVAYASERGGTAEIAGWAGTTLRRMGAEADVRPAAEVTALDGYDAVIVGGALYMGRWHRDARHFVRRHAAALARLPVWLFSSGPLDRTAEKGEIDPVRGVAKLARRVDARGHATFGGRLDADAKGLLAAKIAQQSGGDYRDRDQIAEWAAGIARELEKATA
ncbi:flavodoxin domain-containing protein [Actinomadura latina]|uniref:Flavodoxin n=1 Tax=Actinomadura latina TaxID=163603 RepID=A0A846ZBZ5_9ACTN|nr:flavodoxin domain-containing protein [Actinomadura latina]NKZ07456.1 flavodoxin [Actinomadura latina]